MQEVSFQRFIDLIEFDRATRVLEKEKEQEAQALAQLEEQTIHLNKRLQEEENRLKKAKLSVKEKEGQMQEFDDLQKQKEAQLERINNPREYLSLSSEIERLKNKQHNFEPELVEAWTSLENVTREVNNSLQAIDKKIEELKDCIEKTKQTLNDIDASIAERLSQRDSMLHAVPPDLLEKYDAMRSRIANPIVPVYQGSCSACFSTIPQTIMPRLRSKILEQCKGCFRFLYLATS